MKTFSGKIIIKSAIGLMIGLMCMLIANKAIFTHLHRNSDGTVLVHAHPYDKSTDSKPYKSHNHSKAEVLFLQILEILFLFFFLTFTLYNFDKRSKYLTSGTPNYFQTRPILHKNRAPPV
jgi:hypothetical protein